MPNITIDSNVTVRQKQVEWMLFTRDELAYALDKYHDSVIAKKGLTTAKSVFLAMLSFAISGFIAFFCSEFKSIANIPEKKIEEVYLVIHGILFIVGLLGYLITWVIEKCLFSTPKHDHIRAFVEKESENRPVTSASNE